MNHPDHIFESLKQYFGLKYLNPLTRIRDGKNSDPGWKNFGSGMRDKHPGSATLTFKCIVCSSKLYFYESRGRIHKSADDNLCIFFMPCTMVWCSLIQRFQASNLNLIFHLTANFKHKLFFMFNKIRDLCSATEFQKESSTRVNRFKD
jgi:hypothetical protein